MENEVVDEDTGEVVDGASLRLARETLTGDLRDAALEWIRALPKPWAQLSSEQQRDVIESVTKRATVGAARAVELVASSGRKTIAATVESVTVKDGVKVVLKTPLLEESVLFLVLSAGTRVQIVEADLEPFTGERAAAEPDPDQSELGLPKDDDGQ